MKPITFVFFLLLCGTAWGQSIDVRKYGATVEGFTLMSDTTFVIEYIKPVTNFFVYPEYSITIPPAYRWKSIYAVRDGKIAHVKDIDAIMHPRQDSWYEWPDDPYLKQQEADYDTLIFKIGLYTTVDSLGISALCDTVNVIMQEIETDTEEGD